MCNFKQIIITKDNSHLKNIAFIPEIFDLMELYKHKIFDDYFIFGGCYDNFIKYIIDLSPNIWAIVTPKKHTFIGFVFLDNWTGNEKSWHSATLTTCIKKKYWGKYTSWVAKRFIKYIFKNYGLQKLKAEVFSTNFRVKGTLKKLGFQLEGILQNETINEGKLATIELYSILRRKYEQ